MISLKILILYSTSPLNSLIGSEKVFDFCFVFVYSLGFFTKTLMLSENLGTF